MMSPTVARFAVFSARSTASSAARPRPSSPMPGAYKTPSFSLDGHIGPGREHRVEVCRERHDPSCRLLAQLDTVFAAGTDVTVKEKDGVLYAPGIGDDGRGLAALLACCAR